MIDLSRKNNKLYGIKINTGKVLKIKPPTRNMILQISDLINTGKKKDITALNELYELLTDIFNNNVNKMNFTNEQVAKMVGSPATAVEVLKDYLTFSFDILGE